MSESMLWKGGIAPAIPGPGSPRLEAVGRNEMAIVFGAALLLRIAYLALNYREPASLLQPDSIGYQTIAQNILAAIRDGSPGAVAEALGNFRVPLYPLYLATIELVVGPSMIWPVCGQILLDSATCCLVARLGRAVAPPLGLIAGLAQAVNLCAMVHATSILADTVTLFFIAGFLMALVRYFDTRSARDAWHAGTWLGLAVATRPLPLVFAPLAGAACLYAAFASGLGSRRALHRALAAVLPAALVLGAVVVKNGIVYHHFQFITQGGLAFVGWEAPVAREYAQGVPQAITRARLMAEFEAVVRERAQAGHPPDDFERNAIATAIGMADLLSLGPAGILKAWTMGAAINTLAPILPWMPWFQTLPGPPSLATVEGGLLGKAAVYLARARDYFSMQLLLADVLVTVLLRLLELAGLLLLLLRDRGMRDKAVLLALSCLAVLVVNGPITGSHYMLPVQPALSVLLAAALDRVLRGRSAWAAIAE